MEAWVDSLNILKNGLETGEQIYELLSKRCPAGAKMVICPMHIGDTVLLAAYARAYKEYNDCSYLIFVVNDYQNSLIRLWPDIDASIPLTPNNMEALSYYVFATGRYNDNNILFASFKAGLIIADKISLYRDGEKDDTVGGHARRYLGLPDSAVPTRIKGDLDSAYMPDTRFKGNEVMLCPCAKSESMLPEEFWEILADKLKGRGYKVYTNFNNRSGEYVVKGTEAISSDLNEILDYCMRFKAFISIRSGICDLIGQTDAPLYVIYTSDRYWDDLDLIEMGKTDRIWKYRYADGEYNNLVKRIMQDIVNE